ncbi:hypothetical protein HHK36_003209 [Tetracentron sinense]|uniref:WPP domain-associated protein n=1 Tax=Tetracentron sinense TaxID=13715 RepID=A0A834ZXW4_TETSI|nr:hypothetical protein HHK36_003209 [Tetracentron sinense]
MENSVILESSGVFDARVTSCRDGSMQQRSSLEGSENLGNELLDDLDSYLEDINDRLTISRMVSDSVIKGMVNAVKEEAAEKITMRELEVAALTERLQFYQLGADKSESLGSSAMWVEPKRSKCSSHSSNSGTVVELGSMKDCLGNLRITAKEQFKRLRIEIDDRKASSSIRRLHSGPDLLGLGGILQEKLPEKWVEVDKTLENLKTTLNTVNERVEDMVYLSNALLSEWKQEREFQEELEAMVIRNSVRSLQEEFEVKLWEQRAEFYDSQSINHLAKINELSSLRQDLDVISRSLSIPEIGQLSSHLSHEGDEEWNNAKREDHFHRKVLSSHMSLPASLREGNGKQGESKDTTPECMESSQLKRMTKDDLVSYFRTEMANVKRNHESTIQEMTEEYFTLKREFLKERASSSSLRKDKEFDVLRKKITEVTLKLDDVFTENEKITAFCDNSQSLSGLKDKLDALLSENCQLRDLLTYKRKEVARLLSQVPNAADKVSHHSLAEVNLMKQVSKLKCVIEDVNSKAFVREEVYKCVLKEMASQIKWDIEESDMESIIMPEICGIIFKDAVRDDTEVTINWGIEDSDMESIIMQEMCGIIFIESIKDAEAKLNLMKMKYENENKIRVLLEANFLEKEKALKKEIEEKERLKQEILLLSASVQENEKLALEARSALTKEKEQFEPVFQELNKLKDHAIQQQILISESRRDSDTTKGKLVDALEKKDLYEVEISKLNQKLKLAMKELMEGDEERKRLQAVIQEKQNNILSVEAKERVHRKQMESIIMFAQGLSKSVVDYGCRVAENIQRNNLRFLLMSVIYLTYVLTFIASMFKSASDIFNLFSGIVHAFMGKGILGSTFQDVCMLEYLNIQCSPLIQKANLLERTGLVYKQRLERRCSDLQKAEAEVDLLGDEVDALLSLLEKIYMALDHYSPILQHYPGIE